ncbi:family 61 putative glycoside hydrolase [Triangularia setosa]|uniref:lytic cellulose monooxygenase (C4-dehydrogenating) n=1 Tax=Triangularia setosa TaxID=2587417 RepID=A0AAN6W527_9PEZI|nr:family 61 putative glycoside hydrolase [Podospora setosa]
MKSTFFAALTALAAKEVTAHATFQQLWHGSSCARLPPSNSPVTNVGGRDFVCNAGTRGVTGKCPARAGGTVTIEMHQQTGDRSCSQEAIGGAHYGPVQVYLSKVPDASTADGTSTGWFKIFSNSWSKKAGGRVGDDDNWGSKDLNACCGKMDVKIPADIPAGDYLLRAESLALHAAGPSGGGQFYMTCYQITVTGGGNASPATVRFPGAYGARDGQVNIHAALASYTPPGPAVYSGGTTKVPGQGCSGCESTCKVGSSPSAIAPGGGGSSPAAGGGDAGGGDSGCAVQMYGQCGGNGYTGCTNCASGSCKAVSPPYYSQCA